MPLRKPPVGSVFQIPLSDGGYVIGQVIAYEPDMLNSVSCLFTSIREWAPGDCVKESEIVACLFTTYDLLTKGEWQVVGEAAIPISQDSFPYENLRLSGWVGAKMTGSGIVQDLMNAWFCFAPWDDWADPNYLDGLLFKGRTRPENVMLSKS